jgi:hypothetical protein
VDADVGAWRLPVHFPHILTAEFGFATVQHGTFCILLERMLASHIAEEASITWMK